MRTRNKIFAGFAYLILAACMIWFVVSGVAVLAKKDAVSPNHAAKGDICEFKATYAVEGCVVNNSVEFIPMGKEHYYIMMDEEGLVPFLVRAKPSWIEKNFDASGFAVGGGVMVSGTVTRLDYEVTKEVREARDYGFDLKESQYIDTRYREFGRLRIFSGVGVIVIGVLFYFGMVSGILQNRFMKAVFSLVMLGVAVLMLYTIGVGGI